MGLQNQSGSVWQVEASIGVASMCLHFLDAVIVSCALWISFVRFLFFFLFCLAGVGGIAHAQVSEADIQGCPAIS